MNSLIYAFPWPWFYLMTNLENELKGGIVMLGGGGGEGGGPQASLKSMVGKI